MIATCATLVQPVSKRLGRVPTILLVQTCAISCLVGMILLYRYHAPPLVVVAIYLVRTGLMNSTFPLRVSILMDYVPQSERARWKSLDSVRSFGWAGSAVLGGYLGDLHHSDYTYTFVLTAALQSTGVVMLAPLWAVVEDEHEEGEQKQGDKKGGVLKVGRGTTALVTGEIGSGASSDDCTEYTRLPAEASADIDDVTEPLLVQEHHAIVK